MRDLLNSLTMRSVTITDLRASLGRTMMDVLDGDTIEVVRNGRTIGYLVSPRDWDALNGLTGEQLAEACGVTLPDVEREITALVAEHGERRIIAEKATNTAAMVLTPRAAHTVYTRLRGDKEG